MPRPTKRATRLREAAAHVCSICSQSQSATTPAALEYGNSTIHSIPGTPDVSDTKSPAPLIQNASDDEEISAHINEQDPDNSPPSVTETDIHRSGVLSKNISGITVIIRLTLSRKICHKHWHQSMYQPFKNGSIRCSVGWMLIEMA